MERASGTLTPELADEYQTLWDSMAFRPEKLPEVDALVTTITKQENQDRYQAVSAKTGVPWPLIAALHSLECSLSFKRHLHNGDPLSAKTVNVPAGRPTNWDPDSMSWQDSAVDALRGLSKQKDWSIAGMAFAAESYNGWGYRKRNTWSPYLWSFSNQYSTGKFVSDGVWSSTARSNQCGAMVLLRRMEERGLVTLSNTAQPHEPTEKPAAITTAPAAQATAASQPPVYPGRPLRIGSPHSDSVTLVQQRLNKLGCGPVSEDGDFGGQTDAAVRLFQGRFQDEDDQDLKVDGIVGAWTWEALFGRPNRAQGGTPVAAPTTDLCLLALEVARGQIGVSEDPPGSNRGPEVDEYLQSVKLDPGGNPPSGYPWCVAFVYWCFDQAAKTANVPNPVPMTAGVLDLWNKSANPGFTRITAQQALADPSLVEPGMVFFLKTSETQGHAGLVVAQANGVLDTIEGNTNTAGSREGIGVFRKSSRRLNNTALLGFARYVA